MATKRTPKPTDGTPFPCEHCGREFDTRTSRGAHYRWCEKRPGYEPPAKKKRAYTQSPATRRQRRTAALKHGDRSDRPFAANACTAGACKHPDGRPCEFRESVVEQGADNAVCWPDALGLSADRPTRLDELQATYKKGLDDPIVLDGLKARDSLPCKPRPTSTPPKPPCGTAWSNAPKSYSSKPPTASKSSYCQMLCMEG